MIDERNRIEVILNSLATATPIDDPRDRLELFISAIAEVLSDTTTVLTLEPRDRTELILNAIAEAIKTAGLITTESLSVTENGTYTAASGHAYTPVTVNVPLTTIESLSVTENGTYTASSGHAYSPVTVNVPLPENALLLNTTTVGATVTFSNGADAPLDELVLSINPLQAGTGDPTLDNVRAISGWNGANVYRTAQNLWNETWELGTITLANGVNSSADNRIRSAGYIGIKPNTEYYFKNPLKESAYFITFYYDANKTYLGQSKALYVDNQTFTTPAEAYYMRFVSYTDITTYGNDVSINYPSTDTTYHAYNGLSMNISFGTAGTVYSGTLNVGSGLLTVTHGIVDISTKAWTMPNTGVFRCNDLSDTKVYVVNDMPNAICSCYKPDVSLSLSNYTSYGANKSFTFLASVISLCVKDSTYESVEDFVTAINGQTLVYELATPLTYNLTPTQIRSLIGLNNIYGDCGNITSCKYFSK